MHEHDGKLMENDTVVTVSHQCETIQFDVLHLITETDKVHWSRWHTFTVFHHTHTAIDTLIHSHTHTQKYIEYMCVFHTTFTHQKTSSYFFFSVFELAAVVARRKIFNRFEMEGPKNENEKKGNKRRELCDSFGIISVFFLFGHETIEVKRFQNACENGEQK